MYYELTDQFEVAADALKTWEFFSRAQNLPDITPPTLGFTIKTHGDFEIELDSIIDYTIRWAGVPIRWRTKIIDWSPPRQFIDLQIRGPYSLWHHRHRFTPAESGGGTICEDRVIYRLPGSFIGRAMHAITVKKQLLDIFTFRRKIIGERLGLTRTMKEITISRLG